MLYPGPIRSGPPEALMILYWLLLAGLILGGGIAFYCADVAARQNPPPVSVQDAHALGVTLWTVAVCLEVIRRVVRKLLD